jgi:hypothetical protein
MAAVLAGAASALLGVCGPFTDVSDAAFCPFVLEIFTLGITTGTTPTTYDPTSSVSRLQMAAFLSRTVDGSLKRGSARAALDQFWTPKTTGVLGLTTVGSLPVLVATDGADVWVANNTSDTVSRVRASDGKLLETWTGATGAFGILAAMGNVLVAGDSQKLYKIDPAQPAGSVTTVATNLGGSSEQMAFDGARIWTANTPSVSIVTPGASIPWTVTNVSTGFSVPRGILFDGANVWITDAGADKLFKLDAAGAILQTITVGDQPVYPVFDGSNIWVPNSLSSSVSVVRASTGAVLATLTGNNLTFPFSAAFDGQRVLIAGNSNALSLFKAADLTALGNIVLTGDPQPYGVCSDGRNFWIAFSNTSQLARF